MKIYVQKTIGEIKPDAKSDLGAAEAAFLMIARHGEEGTYEFDLAEEARERGYIEPDSKKQERVRVTVEWPDYLQGEDY